MSSFAIALTGLEAQTQALDVISNNLANLSTTGYKASTASFQDLVNESLSPGDPQNGAGVGPVLAIPQFTQGSITQTSGAYDAAIQGNGFFVVQDQSGNTQYTRAGNFQLDSNGNLVTSSGDYVLGWTASDGTVDPSGAISKITIQPGALQAPTATTEFSLDMNLDASAQVGNTSGTFSQPIQVVDSLGDTHTLTATFTMTAANTWSYAITIPGADVGATSSTPTSLATGSLTFDGNGQLTSPASSDGPVAVQITGLADGASDINANWNLYDSNNNPTITQLATASALSGSSQDGVTASTISGVQISTDGQIVAQYSSGTQQVVGQIAVAGITNPSTMVSTGNNNFELTSATAAPTIGTGGTGGRGTVEGGALEGSTADIATEFTNLIVTQRAYEADSKVISSMDELTQYTINLKQ